MEDKTVITIVSYLCGTAVLCFALYLGYNNTLVAAAIAGLWGVREVIGYKRKKKE